MHLLSKFRNYVGEAIVAVGVLHSLSAVAGYRDQWGAIREQGFWNSVSVAGSGLEGEATWFAVAGGSYLFTGLLVRAHVRATGTLPVSFAAGMTALALGLCIVLPASGAWMALGCGVWTVLVALGGGAEAAGQGARSSRTQIRAAAS